LKELLINRQCVYCIIIKLCKRIPAVYAYTIMSARVVLLNLISYKTVYGYSKFKAGDGDLELYCTEADELHNELLSCPRPLPRIATTPLPPTPKDRQLRYDHWSAVDSPSTTPPRRLLESRRMSRSEGDLKKFVMQQYAPTLRSAGSQQHLVLVPRYNGLAQKVGT